MNKDLAEFIQTRSPEAFRRIVEANIDSVYSQCRRKLHNVAQAEDAAQTVFATLAQKARRLPVGVVLEGWLFTTTRFCCSNAQRAATRRTIAEQKAAIMKTETVVSSPSIAAASAETEALLDDAIARLGERDRNAILLRFFGGRTPQQVADALGVSEHAAKQRIFRAVEKLLAYFNSRGITADSATIAGALGAAVKPAGAELARSAARVTAAKTGAGAGPLTGWWIGLGGVAAALTLIVAVVAATNGGATTQPAATAPGAVLAADTSPPSSHPANQSSPADALKKLSGAIQNNDTAAIAECLCNDGDDPDGAAMAHAYFIQQAAVWRFEHAWHAKFPEDAKIEGLNFDDMGKEGTFEQMIDKLLQLPGGLDVTTNGDIAQVRILLPKSDFPRPPLSHWSGAMLTFKQVDGQWKLDTDLTFTFICQITRRVAASESPVATQTKFATAFATGLNEVAGGLLDGTITTRAKARGGIQDAAKRAVSEAHIDGPIYALTLPVVGG